MKGKVLLGCVLLSGGLVISYQSVERETVSAETRENISSQQETVLEVESSLSADSDASNAPVESMTITESSATEQSSSSEGKDPVASTTSETETKESTTESKVDEEKIPEAVVKVQTPLPAAKVEENYQFSVVKNQTTEEFIHLISKDAQRIAWNEGLYASVMIAQAILETGSGNSQLARPPHHNLFGIKGSYQGKKVTFNTEEDKGNGQLYTIKSAFRQYPSYKESLEDYAALLKNGLSGNPTFYQATWKEYAPTYKEATKALTGKYATDTSYDKKLNALIETYGLDFFDQEPEKETLDRSEESSMPTTESTTAEEPQPESSSAQVSKPSVKINETKQRVQKIPAAAQRPANQLPGNRAAQ